MKNVVAVLCLASFAGGLAAQEIQAPRIHKFPTREVFNQRFSESPDVDSIVFKRGNNISYHNGPVILSAKVVFIFWGPTFSNVGSADWQYAQALISFRNQFGTTGEYNVITQYYQSPPQQFIQLSNLAAGTADMFDSSNPPTAVQDSNVQAEVQKYLSSNSFNASTIYEVVIPSTSYSEDQGQDSCGGPNLVYCAYHSSYTSGSNNVIYSIEPYPSCGGCQVSGWTPAQNQDHFVCHETREAVTDPLGTGWWNSRTGAEADDQCAWNPSPFLVGSFGYQYEWSNANSGCVKTR